MKKIDQSTGEVLFAVGCRDDRPIVDCGCVVSTCPSGSCDVGSDRESAIQNEFGVCWVNLCNITASTVMFLSPDRSGSSMNVNFEVTDAKRAILSVHKGCGNGSMIVFTPDGKVNIVNDKKCIEQVKQIMESTPGFDIVYDRRAHVLDVDVNDGVYVNGESRQFEHDSGISFPVIRKEYWERALSQAQQDHERQQGIQQDVHGENQHTFEQIKVKVPQKPYEPTKEERQSHEATQYAFRAWLEICVKAKSPGGKHTKQLGNGWLRQIDSIHGSIFGVVVWRRVDRTIM